MVNKFKKLIVVLLGVLCAFSFGACSAGVDVIEESDADNWYFEVRVKLDITLNTVLDSGASVKVESDNWTVNDWLNEYFLLISADRGMTVKFNGRTTLDGAYNYNFGLTAPKKSKAAELFELDEQKNYKQNLFLRKYDVTREDRFNPFIEQFNDVYKRFESQTPTMQDYSSEMGIVLLGKRTYYPDKGASSEGGKYIYDSAQKCCYTLQLPAFNAAFPTANNMQDYKNFSLDNYWLGSKRLKINSDDKVNNYGKTYYVFNRSLGDEPSQIEYSYYRAISAGWFMVSIVAGILSVGVIYLVCKIKDKRKPKDDPPKIVHPIDPFS